MKRYVLLTLKVLLITLLIFSAARLASLGAGLLRDRQRFEEMRSEAEQNFVESGMQPDTGDDANTAGTASQPDVTEDPSEKDTVSQEKKDEIPVDRNEQSLVNRNAARFSSFTERNPDFAGWLLIEGTKIDYPVMYSPKEPDFYLTHDFDRNGSSSGVPYIGKTCSLYCDNIILYAHNMKNGTMFAGLLKYGEESYYKEHPVIRFDTLMEDGTYDIISVFRERVHYQDEVDVFRYYNFCGDLSRTEFEEYISQIKALSLYDTGKTAVYGQKLLTLSTCSYHTENGRFVVVAVKR